MPNGHDDRVDQPGQADGTRRALWRPAFTQHGNIRPETTWPFSKGSRSGLAWMLPGLQPLDP